MKKNKVSIGLINPKNPENVGSVMRAAGNFRADSVFYTGNRYPRAVKLNKGTMNSARRVSRSIPLSGVECLVDSISGEMKIVCIELAEGAIALPDYQHPEKAIYIFGPEDGTIEQAIIDRADDVVYVPTIACMNLAATVNVVLYDRLAKSSIKIENNALIRQSRDTNNNLKVKTR